MSSKKKGTKQKLFDLTVVLLVLAGLTIYAVQKGRLSFTPAGNIPTPKVSIPTTPTITGPKTYVSDNFPYEFTYSQRPNGCNKQITVSLPWVMNDSISGIDVYCQEGKNLVQILLEKTDKDVINWWYSLLSDNKEFFEKYGEMKNVVFAGVNAKQITYQKNGENDHYNQAEFIFKKDGINYLVVALDYMCTMDKSCWQGAFEQELLNSFRLINLDNQTTVEVNEEAQICGGILGRTCPDGYTCQYDGNYPDATGKCTKNN